MGVADERETRVHHVFLEPELILARGAAGRIAAGNDGRDFEQEITVLQSGYDGLALSFRFRGTLCLGLLIGSTARGDDQSCQHKEKEVSDAFHTGIFQKYT
jgi:hypothetical protein